MLLNVLRKTVLPILLASTSVRADEIFITTWLHKNDWAAALDSLSQNGDLVDEASPAWYALAEQGEILPREGYPNDPKLVFFCRSRKIILRPLLSNVSAQGAGLKMLREMLTDHNLRSHHVQAIRWLVLGNDLDGIDLDYEGLSISELGALANLVEEAAEVLHHSGKSLAVTLQPWLAEAATPHWRRIGAAADSVRLMLYDQHIATGSPGPTASLDWMTPRLALIIQAVPLEKLSIGLATFANQWQPGGSRSGTWQSLAEPLLSDKDKLWCDPASGSVRYQDGERIIWFEDARGIQAKMKLAMTYGVRRFAFWRLGGEDPNLWKVLRGWKPLPAR